MKTFIIKRSKWARGGKNGSSQLLNEKGAMCCLGFFSRKLGATPKQIRDVPAPHCLVQKFIVDDNAPLAKKWKRLFKGLVVGKLNRLTRTNLADKMMPLNDNEEVSELEREKGLTKMFAKLGWKPKFID